MEKSGVICISKNTLFYIGSTIIILKYAMSSTNYPFDNPTGHMLVGIGLACFVMKIILTKYTLRQGICFLVLLLAAYLVLVQSGDDALVVSLVMGIAMKDTDLRTFFKIWTVLYLFIFLFTVGQSLSDSQIIYNIGRYDQDFGGDGMTEVSRYSFGFSHPNALQGTFFRIICGVLLLTDSKMVLVFAELLNVFLYTYSKSRTGFLCITVLILGFAAIKRYGRGFPEKWLRRIAMTAELIIVFCDLFIVLTYGKYPFLIWIDLLATGRFSLAYRLKRVVPYTLFGCDIFEYDAPFTIDNGIWLVILSYGLVTFAGFFMAYIYALNKLCSGNNYRAIVVIITCTMYSVSEATFGNLFISPALIIIFYMAFNDWIIKPELFMAV